VARVTRGVSPLIAIATGAAGICAWRWRGCRAPSSSEWAIARAGCRRLSTMP